MNTIPLHLLPDKAAKRVLQVMEISNQLSYSLCSKSTKKSIKSLNLKGEEISIIVVDSINAEISVQDLTVNWNTMKHNNVFPNSQFMVHEGVQFTLSENDGTRKEWKWDFGTLDFKKLLHHFCEVLHKPKVTSFEFLDENIDDSCIEPIQKVIGKLQIVRLGLSHDLTNKFTKKALESFPNYEELSLYQSFFDSQKLNKLLIQNLKSVIIHDAAEIKIDQVLLTNSERIHLYCSSFNEEDFNRFLKLWIRGSNPRLKHFVTIGDPTLGNNSLDENLVLEGIERIEIPLDSEEEYRDDVYEGWYVDRELAGGSRIWRFDGTTAVIVVTENEFEFIVE